MDIVYLITDTISGLKYIGSKKNWQGHGTYFGSPSCKSKIFKKYALQQEWKKAVKERPETFELIILESFDEIEHKELFVREKVWQVKYDVNKSMEFINVRYATKSTLGNLYEDLSEEEARALKKKISKGLKKTISKMSPEERREKWSRPGESNPNYGNTWSDELREAWSKELKRKYEDGEIEKYRLGKTNIQMFGDEKAKEISEKLSNIASERIGEKNPFYGKTHSAEFKEKLRQIHLGRESTLAKKVYIDGVEYNGLERASKATGVKPLTIRHRISSDNHKYDNYSYSLEVKARPNNCDCTKCVKKKESNNKTLVEMCVFAKSKSGDCLSEKYTNSNTIYEWKCKNNHIWKASWNHIRNLKNWCTECSNIKKYYIKDLIEHAEIKDGKCLSNEYSSSKKIKWECKFGHNWEAYWASIKHQNQWCPECAGKRQKIEDLQKHVASKNGKCLSEKYINCDSKIEWQCEFGHRWQAKWTSVKNQKSWCQKCYMISKKSSSRSAGP